MKYPNITFGQVEAVWNKLGGVEGVQRFLAGTVELVVKSIPQLINAAVHFDAVLSHDPQAFFQTSDGLWVSDEFRSRILSKARPVKNLAATSGKSYDLTKNSYDRDITPGLPEGYAFDPSEACARIAAMILKQSKGEEGDLIKNGYANLFYVGGCVVRVYWRADDRKWRVHAWKLDVSRWNAGRRVFSRN